MKLKLVAGLTLLACACALIPEEELGDNPLPEKKVVKRGWVGLGYGYRVFLTPDSVSHVSFNTARYIPTPVYTYYPTYPSIGYPRAGFSHPYGFSRRFGYFGNYY
uniref:Uncharacterized protein n=1 Tax=Timema bartmani TaxID=61472 RepID=A0A7R9F995_9NEOP|nr:unnamed protein product [Timema bartmani]